jgi:ATP synthase protein I
MTTADDVVHKARKSRKYQIIIIAVIAVLFTLRAPMHGAASLYGGFVSLFVSWTLGLGVIKATKIARDDPKTAMGILYGSAVLRFVLVLVLFGVGIGSLGFNPIPLVLTAVVTWVAGVIAIR